MPTGSYDERQYPSGPRIEPGGGSSLRGPKRIGPIRGIVPGDDVEVAREIARLWEWHYRLEVAYRRVKRLAEEGGGGNFGCFTSKVLDQEDEDLVLYYDMQEASGAVQDRSGNSRHATSVVGSPEYAQAGLYPSEPSLGSIKFSPTSQQSATDTFDHFVLPASAIAFGGTASFTIEAVVRYLGVPTTHQTIVSAIETNGTSGWSLRIKAGTNGAVFEFKRGSVTVTTPDVPSLNLELGKTYHVAAIYDGANLRIYFSGFMGGKTATVASLTASTVAYLGRDKISATNYYFNDRIAAVAIWSRAVVEKELFARSSCLTDTGTGDPDDLSTDPDGSPSTAIQTITGNAWIVQEGIYAEIGDNRVSFSNLNYWMDRGWVLLCRGSFNDLNAALDNINVKITALGVNQPLYIATEHAGATYPLDVVTDWVKFKTLLGEDDDTHEVLVEAGNDSVFFDSEGGSFSVQLYWIKEEDADVIIDEQDESVPAGGATNDILEWNGSGWVPDKLEDANVDAAAAIAYAKLNLAASIVNADVAAAAAIAVTKLAAAPIVRVRHSVAQAIATATWTSLNLDTEDFDTDVIHDTVTNNTRLTCKTAGKYIIVGSIVFAGVNAGTIRGSRIWLNGVTNLGYNLVVVPGANDALAQVTVVYELAVNDYVELQAFHDRGVNLNTVAASYAPVFSMSRLSA